MPNQKRLEEIRAITAQAREERDGSAKREAAQWANDLWRGTGKDLAKAYYDMAEAAQKAQDEMAFRCPSKFAAEELVKLAREDGFKADTFEQNNQSLVRVSWAV